MSTVSTADKELLVQSSRTRHLVVKSLQKARYTPAVAGCWWRGFTLPTTYQSGRGLRAFPKSPWALRTANVSLQPHLPDKLSRISVRSLYQPGQTRMYRCRIMRTIT